MATFNPRSRRDPDVRSVINPPPKKKRSNKIYETITIDGQAVDVGPREAQVFRMIQDSSRTGRPISAPEIEEKIWGSVESEPPGHIVRVTLDRLKKRLSRAGIPSARIQNTYGDGYTVVQYGPVTEKPRRARKSKD
jgi:DNA-binding response OmpR family regulator